MRAVISATGLIVPRTFETCAKATSTSWEGYYEYKDVRLNYRYANCNKKARSTLWTGGTAGSNADSTGAAKPYVLASPELVQAENAMTWNVGDLSGSDNYLNVCLIGAREEVCKKPARGMVRCA